MSNAVAKVSFLQGQAWAKAPDGTLRALTVGSTLNDDEVLVTAQGARIELDVGTGEPLVVNGGLEVGMSRDFRADTATEADEALLSDASVQEALTVLDQGGDLLEELEDTAAGNTGGGGGSEGHDFVQLTRVIESTNPQAFDYSSTFAAGQAPVENDADYTNRAPLVTDQVIASNEDEAVIGQIIADDIEDDALTFTLTTPPVNGVLLLDPVTGQFTFTPNANYNGPDSFVVTVTDSRGNSTSTNIALNIAPVNDAPTTNDINLTTDEDVPVNGQVVAQDIENDALSYVVSGQPANGTVVLDPATGTFVYTPNTNYNGSDSFVVTVSDGNGGTTTSTVRIGINPVNDAPVSSDQNLVTEEDTPIDGQVLASDVDGDILGYSLSGQPTNGTVVLNPATGGFTYTPNANYNGGDSFVVTISDGNGGTTTSRINIGVTPVNDAPVSSDQNLTTPEDTPLPGQVVATDVEGDTLVYVISGQPTSGTVTLDPATGSFVYTPNANYNGGDSFVVTISDGNGGTTTSRINIGVTPVNDAPVSSDQNLTTPEDTPLPGQVVATDLEGDTLGYVVSGQPTSGTVTLDPATGSFVYTPNANYNGSDSFVVTISDGNGGTTTSRINIGVTPVNDAPVSSDQNLTTPEDTPLPGQVVATDIEGDTLAYVVSGQPTNGSVTLNSATGGFVYTPNANYNGSDSFVVTISDGNGGTTTSRVNIGVTPVNDAPVSGNQNLSTPEDTPINGQISASDTDGGSLGYSISGSPANGSVTLNPATGSFVYTPNAGYNGSDSFVVTISDGNGGTTTSRVNIGVTPVNDAPVANNDTAITKEATAVTVAARANDTDPDADPLTVTGVTQGANGSVVIDAITGNPIYTPNAGFVGSDSFSYTINDGNGGSATATVTVTVNTATPINNAPVAVTESINVAEGGTATVLVGGATSVLTNDTDAENDPLTAILVTGPTNGSLTLNADGTFSYVHNGSETTSDSFTYKVNDGTVDGNTVTVNINVAPQNNAPVAVTESINVAEGGTATVLVGGATSVLTNDTDAENDPLTAILVTGPTNGSLTLNADGTFSYVHNGSETTSDSFTYKVNDGTVDGNTVTVNINVAPQNNAPVAVTESINVAEGGTATVLVGGATSVLTNDTDAENDPLTAILVTGPANGSLTLNADGTFSYVHNGSETTTDSFTYKVNDGTVDGNTVTVNINVAPVNEAPVAVADSATVDQDEVLTLTAAQLLVNDTDPELDTLTIDSVQDAVNGSVSIVGGDVVFTPTPGYHGPASFTYTITDGDSTSTATVSVTVEKANIAPVANDDAATSTGSSNIGFVSEYYGYNDTVHGPNLSSIQQLYSFIDGRAADATFTAQTFDYGNGTFNNGLGNGTNLQTFLGSDAASLSADPATTSDAIIRMRGFIELDAGTYNFKVTADDGYQIRVDGVVVAEFNQNQSVSTTTHSSFTLTTSGLHTVEIVYWDQGISARLKLELSDDAGVSYDILSSIPTHQNVIFSAVEDTALSIPAGSLLGNDTDADGDTLVIQSVQGAVNGSVSLVAGSVVFTPAANYSGPASFTYTISDGKGGTDTATVSMVVAPVNDAPVAVANSGLATTNGSLSIPVATLLANDTDIEGDILTFVSVQDATNGTAVLSGTNVIFTPTANFEGAASFTYTIRDPMGATSMATVNVNVGAASAPSVVVNKTLLAIAHGTGGVSVKFPIVTALVDTDGSETLSIRVSGVPTGLSFTAGTNLGGGIWSFTEAELPNLSLNLPGSYTTTGTTLTVQVTSTEVNGGFTATTSSTVSLNAFYTTVDVTTSGAGNYNGNASNEYIQGGNGNNTLHGRDGNDIVRGGDGDDTISASTGLDMLYGEGGNDTINGSPGTDYISGGAGNDTMTGGPGNSVDVFAWTLGDQGAAGTPAADTINGFITSSIMDVLDLSDLLQGEHVGPSNGAGNLADYLHFETSGADTIVHISHTGGFSGDSHTVGAGYTGTAETQKITLTGVNLQTLYSGATTDQQIITQLLNNNKLITD